MDAASGTVRSSGMVWAGRILSGLIVVALSALNAMGLLHKAESLKHFVAYGYPESAFVPISIVFFVCIVVYAIPRTAIFGAILFTGYFGGAVATHVRAGEPYFFPIVVAVLVWLGIFLRDARLRALVPLR
ncbi:MAG TPA: DoxX family protein [Candidatus Angelobacter sp.]|nr:DoxX family protein [Candidatus Angelobacter sp.]